MCTDIGPYPNELRGLKEMETLLTCGICYEYLKTAIITPCSHNYCSYCIRKSLLYKSQCPSCFEETSEPQLRSNRILDELVVIFTNIKDALVNWYGKRVSINHLTDESPQQSTSRISSKNLKSKSCGLPCGQVTTVSEAASGKEVWHNTMISSPSKVEVNVSSSGRTDVGVSIMHESQTTPKKQELHIPSMFTPTKQKKDNSNVQVKCDIAKVSCPVCSVEIPEVNINRHLDACLKRSEEMKGDGESKRERRNPLPKLVYSLLQDKALKKKLSEAGLSTLGNRKTLINRHKQYTLLYNSECDSLNPRPVSEIIQQVEKAEREEKKLSKTSMEKLFLNRKGERKANDEARKEYLQQHKASFQDLIKSIKSQGGKKEPRKENADELHENDDPVILISSSFENSSTDDEFSAAMKNNFQGMGVSVHDFAHDGCCSSISESKDNIVKEKFSTGNFSSEDESHMATGGLSPVLITKSKFCAPKGHKKRGKMPKKNCPAGEMLEEKPGSSLATTNFNIHGGEESSSDDCCSNNSFSLMDLKAEDLPLHLMKHINQDVATEQEEKSTVFDNAQRTNEIENINQVEVLLQGTSRDVQQEEEKTENQSEIMNYVQQEEEKTENQSEIMNYDSQTNLPKFGVRHLNFDIDIDNLMVTEENEPVLPITRRSKRKTSSISHSSVEPVSSRILQKRVRK